MSLDLAWIKPRYRANLVNCDILVDSINDPELYEGKLLLSHPYQHGGIALGVAASRGRVPTDSTTCRKARK